MESLLKEVQEQLNHGELETGYISNQINQFDKLGVHGDGVSNEKQEEEAIKKKLASSACFPKKRSWSSR